MVLPSPFSPIIQTVSKHYVPIAMRLLASAKTSEIFTRFRDHISEKLKHNPSSCDMEHKLCPQFASKWTLTRNTVDGYVEEAPRQNHRAIN